MHTSDQLAYDKKYSRWETDSEVDRITYDLDYKCIDGCHEAILVYLQLLIYHRRREHWYRYMTYEL